jgi:hypothetical protein
MAAIQPPSSVRVFLRVEGLPSGGWESTFSGSLEAVSELLVKLLRTVPDIDEALNGSPAVAWPVPAPAPPPREG